MAPFYVTIGNTFKNSIKTTFIAQGTTSIHLISSHFKPQKPCLEIVFWKFMFLCICNFGCNCHLYVFIHEHFERKRHTSNEIRHCNNFIHNTFLRTGYLFEKIGCITYFYFLRELEAKFSRCFCLSVFFLAGIVTDIRVKS